MAATLMIVAIAGSVLLNLLQRSVPTAGSGTAGAPAEAFPRGSEVRAEDKATGGLPTPNPGWRWVTYRDWALQVPQEWGYGFAPRSDWCVEGRRFGQRPFVDPYGDRVPVRSILCAERPPSDLAAAHLRFGTDQPALPAGWLAASSEVLDAAGARAMVVHPDTATSGALAQQILSTLQRFTIDPNGCAISHPIQSGPSGQPVAGGRSGVASDARSGDDLPVLAECRSAAAGAARFPRDRRVGGVRCGR
ncbi:MAG: hypothetical protein IPL43_06380 [Micropruina sp.]|nr:hypothetical protein [Micropruina sp.]